MKLVPLTAIHCCLHHAALLMRCIHASLSAPARNFIHVALLCNYSAIADCCWKLHDFATPEDFPTAGACCTGLAAAAFSARALSEELTSKKWYRTMRTMATEPRKMASRYKSSSEIMVAGLLAWPIRESMYDCTRSCRGCQFIVQSLGDDKTDLQRRSVK